jgi:hypothetical protein
VVLQTALAEAVARADEAVNQIQTEALEQERTINSELNEKLGRLSTEFSLSEERSKSEIAELKERLGREQLSAKSIRADLMSEINVPFASGVELTIDAGVEVGSVEI